MCTCYLWILYFKDKQIFVVFLYLKKIFFYEYQCFSYFIYYFSLQFTLFLNFLK